MLTKSKFLKTTILAALVGLAGAAVVTPASAHGYDGRGGYSRDRDDRGWADRDDRGRGDRDRYRDDRGWGSRDRDYGGWRWRHRHFRHHHNWY